jgi:hypothetical protein
VLAFDGALVGVDFLGAADFTVLAACDALETACAAFRIFDTFLVERGFDLLLEEELLVDPQLLCPHAILNSLL